MASASRTCRLQPSMCTLWDDFALKRQDFVSTNLCSSTHPSTPCLDVANSGQTGEFVRPDRRENHIPSLVFSATLVVAYYFMSNT